MLKVPANYTFQGLPTADSAKYVRDDSTQNLKIDLTVSRKSATFNQSTQRFSVPEYRMVFRKDVATGDGVPTGQRITLDTVIRYPVGTSEDEIANFVASQKALFEDESFLTSVSQQMFPRN